MSFIEAWSVPGPPATFHFVPAEVDIKSLTFLVNFYLEPISQTQTRFVRQLSTFICIEQPSIQPFRSELIVHSFRKLQKWPTDIKLTHVNWTLKLSHIITSLSLSHFHLYTLLINIDFSCIGRQQGEPSWPWSGPIPTTVQAPAGLRSTTGDTPSWGATGMAMFRCLSQSPMAAPCASTVQHAETTPWTEHRWDMCQAKYVARETKIERNWFLYIFWYQGVYS